MNTFMANPQNTHADWYVVDANGETLGRLATLVATYLRGKHKPTYTPHVNTGDYVIVVNAEKIILTGKKWTDKHYYHYSGHNGGLSDTLAKDVMAKFPTRMVERAIKGMLPHNSLGAVQFNHLFVYEGDVHPHTAQQPAILKVGK
ncbi:MAG: 50S ribosomal protein L13 [Acholeplasmatales bacterium]|jgi:large subunit ribosomal protein L13|nr:50S ribosomal protein L13 [Acholeplasmatales bacterium]